MKTKLLKKLRKKHVIFERNGLYRYDDGETLDVFPSKLFDYMRDRMWTTIDNASQIRSIYILKDAQKYRIPKHIIQGYSKHLEP
jgi:hypothetical protein